MGDGSDDKSSGDGSDDKSSGDGSDDKSSGDSGSGDSGSGKLTTTTSVNPLNNGKSEVIIKIKMPSESLVTNITTPGGDPVIDVLKDIVTTGGKSKGNKSKRTKSKRSKSSKSKSKRTKSKHKLLKV